MFFNAVCRDDACRNFNCKGFAESSVNNEVQDPAEIGEIDDYSYESVLECVYNIEEESEENSEEESLGILNPSKAVLLESTSSGDKWKFKRICYFRYCILPEGYVAPKNGLEFKNICPKLKNQ